MTLDPNDPTPAAAAPTRKSGRWVNWLLGAAIVLAIGGVAFAVGRSTAPVAATGIGTFPGGGNFPRGVAVDPNASFAPGGGAGFLGAGGGITTGGQVTAVDASSLTLTLESGESMTFTLDGDTTYHEATSADVGAVAVGDDVAVQMSGGGFPGGGAGGTGDGPAPTAGDVTVRR